MQGGSTTACFSSDLSLLNNMLSAGVCGGREVLGPSLAHYQSDSLESKENLIFPVPLCKTKYYEEEDK